MEDFLRNPWKKSDFFDFMDDFPNEISYGFFEKVYGVIYEDASLRNSL